MNAYLRSVTGSREVYIGTFALPPYNHRRYYELRRGNQEYVLTPAASTETVVGVFSILSDGTIRGSVLGLSATIFVRPFQVNLVIEALLDTETEAA